MRGCVLSIYRYFIALKKKKKTPPEKMKKKNEFKERFIIREERDRKGKCTSDTSIYERVNRFGRNEENTLKSQKWKKTKNKAKKKEIAFIR